MEHELIISDKGPRKQALAALRAFLKQGNFPFSVGEVIDEGDALRVPIEFDLDDLLKWVVARSARDSSHGTFLARLRVRRAEKKAAKKKAPAKKKATKKK